MVFFLCSLTYDATLTELMSLKMMRAVKYDEQIHLDVAVAGVLITPFHTSMARHPAGYSLLPFSCTAGSDRPLQKPQRQGEIVMLGMFAFARRSVVTEHR